MGHDAHRDLCLRQGPSLGDEGVYHATLKERAARQSSTSPASSKYSISRFPRLRFWPTGSRRIPETHPGRERPLGARSPSLPPSDNIPELAGISKSPFRIAPRTRWSGGRGEPPPRLAVLSQPRPDPPGPHI